MNQIKAKKDRRRAVQTKVTLEATPRPRLTPKGTVWALLLLFAVGTVLRLQHVDDVVSHTPDERTYTRNAHRILEKGIREFPAMVHEYNLDPDLPRYPSPLRVGYLMLVAGSMKVTGYTNEQAGAWLSCIASVASLALLAVIGVRFLPPWVATYGMLYLVVSIPDLVVARRCWGDSLIGWLGLLMAWSACEIARDHRKWWSYALLIATGSFCVLVKEFGVFIYGAFILYVLVLLFRRRAWRIAMLLVLSVLVAGALTAYCLTSAAGGMSAYILSWQRVFAATKGNAYGTEYQDGPWYNLLLGFWILSPVNLILSTIAIALSLMPERVLVRLGLPMNPMQISLLRLFAWVTVLVASTMLILPISQSFRYMAPVHGPMYLLGGFGLLALLHIASQKVRGLKYQAFRVLILVTVLAVAIGGYQDFERAYVRQGVPDLSIKMVLDSRH
jgi:hypothetical protein